MPQGQQLLWCPPVRSFPYFLCYYMVKSPVGCATDVGVDAAGPAAAVVPAGASTALVRSTSCILL